MTLSPEMIYAYAAMTIALGFSFAAIIYASGAANARAIRENAMAKNSERIWSRLQSGENKK